MPTDLQAFFALYQHFGIECQVNNLEDSQVIYLVKGDESAYMERLGNITVSDKFEGYSDFFTKITFDLDGNFVNQGFWE